MKILFVTDLCPVKEDEKGLPVTLLNFMTDFITLGHKVTLLRPNVIPNVLIRGRKVLPEGHYLYNGINCINKNYLTPFFYPSQFRFLENENFDVILSHMPSGILAAEKISKLLKIPCFAAVHSSDIKVLSDFKYSFLHKNLKRAYLGAKKILPRSFWLDDEIKKFLPNVETAIIPSGIDFSLIVNEIKPFCSDIKIFSAGSLIKRKNFKELIVAVAKMGIRLEIAGSGKEKSNLQKLINDFGANDKIKLLGQKSKNEVFELMKNADIFVLPSIQETFGMVYLEAMAAGKIVVCTENSGMAGIIKDGYNGFLTKPDSNSIKDTIMKIKNLQNHEIIMERALQTAKDYERLKMAENYLKNILF